MLTENGKTKITMEALQCDEITKQKSRNCEFMSELETWNAVFSAPKPSEKDAIIDFELDDK